MPRRWFSLTVLTAFCGLIFLPAVARGAESDEFCYVAAIESRPWNGPAGGPAAATGGAGLRGDRHGARLGDTWIQSGAGGDDKTWLVLDLQGSCDLEELVLWNYFEFGGNKDQNATLPNRGVASADIYIVTTETGARIPRNGQGAFDFKAAGWALIRPEQRFHKAPVAQGPDHAVGPSDVVDLRGHRAVTHVALTRIKHFASDAFGDYVGLDEIKIVPAPGTYREDPRRPHAELRTAAALGAAAGLPGKYQELLKNQGLDGVVSPILVAYRNGTVETTLKKLGSVLTASPESAMAVLEVLAAQRSVEAASVSAELVHAITAQVGGRRLTDEAAWRPFVQKAATLLEHDDPFVRGIAAWALVAVRDANREAPPGRAHPNGCGRVSRWGRRTHWSANSCSRRSAWGSTGRKRIWRIRLKTLWTGQRALHRMQRHATDKHGAKRVAAALERLEKAYGRLDDENVCADLTGCRKAWIEVRRAAREVVLAGPDVDFQELVFFKAHGRTEGNHPDGLVQNHDRPKARPPGGDIFVQSGTGSAYPARALIAGQLGPGHVQDMDLWWDADRLVFAFVRQPHWGDARSNWGSVPWRNGSRRVVFDHVVGFREGVFWENGSEPTHLYEINLDGSGLRQLTDDKLYCDREPAYLPDGDVVFSSDRGCGASQCGAAPLAYSDFGLPNLFRVSAHGGHVQRLTYNKDVDRYPHCLNNGLIGYMRWDYQERFWQWPHALWTIRPDGTMNDGLFKVHFNDPQSVREPRSIPESRKLVVLACGHHSPPEGAVAVVDPSQGVNNPMGMRYVTPGCSPLEGGMGSSPTVAEGGVPDRGGFYRSPWPLSEKGFLVSYAYHNPAKMPYAVYYIDVWGNKEVIHRDPTMDVLCPMPVRKRPRPPASPSRVAPEANYATCYLDDVHRDMPGVERGTIRYLRISEHLQWYFDENDNTGPIRWTPGTQHWLNFGYWTWSPTRVIGTVPVEHDGSAYFKVPTGLAVYFQALDEKMMEIRRMRSHVEFQPGEFRSCVGCHETKENVPRIGGGGGRLALTREPSVPKPPPWGDVAILDYEEMVQPIFDRHCVACHGAEEPDNGLDLTRTPGPHGFAQSYRSLFGIKPGMPTPLGEGFREAYHEMPDLKGDEGTAYEAVKAAIYNPDGLLSLSNHMSGPEVTAPKQFGSHRSRLVVSLLSDNAHRNDVSLSRDEWETLVTWVDANAPYHSTYFEYFDPDGRMLPNAIRVRIELDPPFKAGEKTYRVVADRDLPGAREAARTGRALNPADRLVSRPALHP